MNVFFCVNNVCGFFFYLLMDLCPSDSSNSSLVSQAGEIVGPKVFSSLLPSLPLKTFSLSTLESQTRGGGWKEEDG